MPRAPSVLYRQRREVLQHIEKLSRTPYQELLADFMRAAPDVKAIKAFAQKYPDRWAQAITLISQLAGFEKGLVINANNLLIIGQLSDAQLFAELGRVDGALQAAGVKLPALKDVSDADVVSSTTKTPITASNNTPGTP